MDLHTSEICQEMDGKVFKLSDQEIGVTVPPFHCHCRTVIAPYFDDEPTRASRDENRNYKEVEYMSYKEWYNNYVEKNKKSSIIKEIKFKILNDDEIKKLQEQSDDVYSKITFEEKYALNKYTGDLYTKINYAIRTNGNELYLKYANDIENAMEKFELNENIKAYRGTQKKYYELLGVGDIFEPNMFFSTSISKGIAEDFSDSDMDDDGIIFEIDIPLNTKCIYIGENSSSNNEKEIILSHKLKYVLYDVVGNTYKLKIKEE